MAEVQVVLTVGKITSKGAFMAGDIVPLPEAEAKDFIRRKWAKPATADAPPVVDAPQVENREDDVAAKTSKRAPGRPRKDKS